MRHRIDSQVGKHYPLVVASLDCSQVARRQRGSSIALPENEPRLLQLRKVSIYAVESGSSAPSRPRPSANWASDSGPFCELIKFLAFQRGSSGSPEEAASSMPGPATFFEVGPENTKSAVGDCFGVFHCYHLRLEEMCLKTLLFAENGALSVSQQANLSE